MQKNLLTVCGLSSVRAVADATPELIERLFFDEKNAPLFAAACRKLAQARKTYRLVPSDELRKITDTPHHQGAAVVMHAPRAHALADLQAAGNALCLNDVLNPHNVGAIVRTAAFFGMQHIIVSQASFAAAMTAAAWRVAEGGLSHVKLYVYADMQAFFQWAKQANAVVAAAVRPEKGRVNELGEILSENIRRPVVVCLGNEENGLPAAFVKACSKIFSIPGSGKIESLNVSVTAALCLEKLTTAIQ